MSSEMGVRLRLLLRKLLAIAMAVSLMPGVVELVESVEHLLHDGHMPHSAQHELVEAIETHDLGHEEHGCTPMTHTCGCHVSSPAVLGEETQLAVRRTSTLERRGVAAEHLLQSRANAPPTPPPIA